jgi:hypothetical protein
MASSVIVPFSQHYPSTFGIAPAGRQKWETASMASCARCEELRTAVSIDQPRQYLEMARRLIGLIDAGAIVLTESSCTLQALFNSEWPSDTAEHNFECIACGRTFQLFADTYNGHAGWDLTGPPTREPAPEPEVNPKVIVVAETW